MSILAILLSVFLPIVVVVGGIILTENPEIIPGHDARVEKREQREYRRQLKQDQESYKDITELAVSMGYPDPGEDGWYGFDIDSETGILYFDGRRFFAYSPSKARRAQETLKYVLNSLTEDAGRHVEAFNKRKQLEQMIDGKPILGERRPWQED